MYVSRISRAVRDGGVVPCIMARKKRLGSIGIRTPGQNSYVTFGSTFRYFEELAQSGRLAPLFDLRSCSSLWRREIRAPLSFAMHFGRQAGAVLTGFGMRRSAPRRRQMPTASAETRRAKPADERNGARRISCSARNSATRGPFLPFRWRRALALAAAGGEIPVALSRFSQTILA